LLLFNSGIRNQSRRIEEKTREGLGGWLPSILIERKEEEGERERG
jgi:hypothetical protein